MQRVWLWTATLLALAALWTSPASADEQDFEHWLGQGLRFTGASGVTVGAYTEARMRNDASALYVLLFGPTLAVPLGDHLGAAAAVRYIIVRPEASTLLDWQRYEIELNPKVKLLDGRLGLTNRNRLERWRGAAFDWQVRHRLKASWALDGAGPLKALTAGDEFFYSIDDGPAFTENRLQPLGLKLKFGHYGMELAYVLRSRDRDGETVHAHLLQTVFIAGFDAGR